ncbi:hypothetical protein NQZ68_003292 [Dissostichus eleginoides]|nr:hypothetical protein NQZ68_003292 [Dissostichus eleginoides]
MQLLEKALAAIVTGKETVITTTSSGDINSVVQLSAIVLRMLEDRPENALFGGERMRGREKGLPNAADSTRQVFCCDWTALVSQGNVFGADGCLSGQR